MGFQQLPGSWRGSPPPAGGVQGPHAGAGGGVTPHIILFLFGLIVLEIAGYVALRYAFRTAHGG